MESTDDMRGGELQEGVGAVLVYDEGARPVCALVVAVVMLEGEGEGGGGGEGGGCKRIC